MSRFIEYLKAQARALKGETHALYLAARDPRTPWLAKLVVAFVVAYALSPIDLIPDFIPILGYLDDRLVAAARHLSWRSSSSRPRSSLTHGTPRNKLAGSLAKSRAAAIVIIVLWIDQPRSLSVYLQCAYFDGDYEQSAAASSIEIRPLAVPASRLLIGMAHLKQPRLIEGRADDLHADRQPLGRKNRSTSSSPAGR